MVDDFGEGVDSLGGGFFVAIDEETVPTKIAGAFDVGKGVIADMKDFICLEVILRDLEERRVGFFDSFFEARDDFGEERREFEHGAGAVEADIPVGEDDEGEFEFSERLEGGEGVRVEGEDS